MRDQPRQLNIQILRALAATLVVIGHAFHDMQALKGAAEAAPTWLDRLNWGWGSTSSSSSAASSCSSPAPTASAAPARRACSSRAG
ncbi:MAG: hypothetical protein ABSF67_23715 [Roseiarcus sp.]|jgi:peptidoglycan/LPS O-acetylase OafA/YrhL